MTLASRHYPEAPSDVPAAETVKRRQQWSRNSFAVLLLSFTGMQSSFCLTLLGTERQ